MREESELSLLKTHASWLLSAFVAQWIEQASPKGKIGVRFPARALPLRIVDCGMNEDESWMRKALREAQQCLRGAECHHPPLDVPVGAICVLNEEVIGRGHNRRELDLDPTAHAEVLAIRQAAGHLHSWHLDNVTLYVTLEPCAMCAGAIWLARLSRVVFGAWDEKAGACGSLFDIARDPRLNHCPQVRGGVLADECAGLLADFFARKRSDQSS
jgi:tRNA(adenine34) deaminase